MLHNRISSCIAAATIATVALRGALFAAEAPAAKPGSSQPPHGVKASDPAKKQSPEAAIRAALAKTVELGYKETPLRDVATDLQSKLGVPVRLDAKALDEIGIGIDSPVTFSSSRLSAKAAIALMLRKHGLKTVIKYESLLITTPEEADNFFLDTRVYDVSDLVRGNGGAAIQDGVCDSLIDVIKTSIGPTTWDDVGGVGTAMPFAAAGIDAIVVRQTAEVCEQVEALLSGLRAIRDARGAGQQPVGAGQTKAAIATMPKSSAGPVLFAPQPSDAEKTVREALRKPVNLQFKETPLCDVIEQLKKATNLPIALDKRMLDAVEVSLKTPITLEGSGRALRAILDELVRAHNLAWTYLDDERSLVVTIPEEERERLVTRSYDLSGMPSYRNERGDGVPDYDAIVEAVTRSIEPTTWVNAGGCGTIAVLEGAANHAIVVTQTWQGHLKIESLLAKLYYGRGVPTKDDIAKLPPGPTDGDGKYLPPTVLELDPKRDSLIRANNDFAFDLYKQASKGGREKGNLFFSPCGIATAMSLVYSGARGQTADEMAKTLRFAMPKEEVPPACHSLLAALSGANQRGCQLTVANRLWGQRGYGFADSFLTTARQYFEADLTEVDFAEADAVCRMINAWVDEATAGRINQIADRNMVDHNTRLYLTNAVYFNGKWAAKFERRNTRPLPFFLGGDKINVPMMTVTDSCRYGVVDDVSILEKPYRGRQIAMMILLPGEEPEALANLERILSPDKLKKWLSRLNTQPVTIFLPKFKLETTLAMDTLLASMGMSKLFDPQQADLSGVTSSRKPLWIGSAVHRALVNVDEEGTEAAAVTGMGSFGGPPPLPTFCANHPFVFLIRDMRTGAILFMGRLMRPESAAANDKDRGIIPADSAMP